MNEQEIRELLKLIRGIEHYLEKCLKTIVEKQLKEQGVEIIESNVSDLFISDIDAGFEF